MQALVRKNDDLDSANQQLNDANYDLRYELQEVRRGNDPRAMEMPSTPTEASSDHE